MTQPTRNLNSSGNLSSSSFNSGAVSRQPVVTNVDQFLANVNHDKSGNNVSSISAWSANDPVLRSVSPPLTTYHAFERPGDEGEIELVVDFEGDDDNVR